MDKSFGQSDTKIFQYAFNVFKPEDDLLRDIRARSLEAGLPAIQVGPMDALHLEVLTLATNAKKVVEIGTLGGYSGVCIARGLPANGKLYTFEYHEHHAVVARESFHKAGLSDKVEVFVGSATDRLHEIESQGPFDLVFLDADKVSYPSYLKWAAKHLRLGGTLIADNTFGWGMIADESIKDDEDRISIQALRDFNHDVAQGGTFRSTILPTGEGLTVCVKVR